MSDYVKELNSKNFDKFISEGNCIVDFWAEWCVAPNTNVYISQLNSISASDITSGKELLSFNNGLSKDKVVFSKSTNMGGHCKMIGTSSGRYLETTDNHLFFTKRGWIAAQDLTNDDKIAVLPVIDPIKFEGENDVLLDTDDFELLRSDYKNLDSYLEELEIKGLLPLKKNNVNLLVLARLAGALFSDGSLYNSQKNHYREISFCLGQKKDVNDLIEDLGKLGFSILHISERENINEIDGREFLTHTFRVKCLSTSLYLLLKILGIPEGNKTDQAYPVPGWIVNGESAIKREFLSGYLGGDGPRISMRISPRKGKGPYNSININDIEFRKRSDLANSGITFANEISKIMRDLGVDTTETFYEIDPYIRKDGKQSAVIHIPIKNNFNNGFVMSQKIGYSYCWQKQLISSYAGEFIRERLRRREIWRELHERVMGLARDGHSYQQVSKALSIDSLLAYQWIVKKNEPHVQKHYLKFDEWLKESKAGLPEGFIWEKVENVEEVYLPNVQIIETERDHNFIANGFLVHNCGPCKMLAPVIDEFAEESKDKIKFGKVNVENEQELAERFSIMAVPAILFFKDGEQVEQATGAVTKEELAALAEAKF